MQGIEFVVASYVLTWIVLGGYTAYVWRRFGRAERELQSEERVSRGVEPGARHGSEHVGGAA